MRPGRLKSITVVPIITKADFKSSFESSSKDTFSVWCSLFLMSMLLMRCGLKANNNAISHWRVIVSSRGTTSDVFSMLSLDVIGSEIYNNNSLTEFKL